MIALLNKLGEKVEKREITWKEALEFYKDKTGEELTRSALKARYYRLSKKLKEDPGFLYEEKQSSGEKQNSIQYDEEVEEYFADGTVMARKIVNLPPEKKADSSFVLRAMGFNPDEWDISYIRFSQWEQHTKTQNTKNLYAVRVQLTPKSKTISREDALRVGQNYFKGEIKPLSLPTTERLKSKTNLMIECPGIELHLGKLAHSLETGQNYDHKIAQERFKTIIGELVEYQKRYNANTLMLSIGNDFFNSDTPSNTTTAGTQMQNDVRWQKMFLIGIKLYTEALVRLSQEFNKIHVNLVPGNHDTQTSFFLYQTLREAFKMEKKIVFSPEYKLVQAFQFGKCAIFTAHGDFRKKDDYVIKSLADEFREVWGDTIYRELHLGHLHTEKVVDEQSGLIIRRVSSPSGTDAWHYENRFVGSRQAHQFFLWHKNEGLKNIHYVGFENRTKKENTKPTTRKRKR